MPIFRVGSETGGREAGDALDFAQTSLNNVFFFDPKLGSYFKTLRFFILALRVSGRTKDFGSEGPENLVKVRGKDCYAIDLVIPEDRWKAVPFDELRGYVLDGVKQCFELCVEKSNKSGELLDEARLRSDFEAGIQEILEGHPGDDIFHLSKGKEILSNMVTRIEQSGQKVDKVGLMKKIQEGVFTA